MAIKVVTAIEIELNVINSLGLDENTFDLSAVEVAACALRRAAGFLCPCSAQTLVQSIVRPLKGLIDVENYQKLAEEVLETLVIQGDLLELNQNDPDMGMSGLLLYAAPPSFVSRKSGTIMLLGITPDNVSPLPSFLEESIRYDKAKRIIDAESETTEMRDQLLDVGLIEIPWDVWLKTPRKEAPDHYIELANQMLEAASNAGNISGLVLLETNRPVEYYSGRWQNLDKQSGKFVARRPQAYGSDLWCYIEVSGGRPIRLIDLPFSNFDGRGCDNAWMLQAAIDYQSGHSQQYKVREGAIDNCIFDFYSPVPMWAVRRWDMIGESVPRDHCLFSYRFSNSECEAEKSFIEERLWLAEV